MAQAPELHKTREHALLKVPVLKLPASKLNASLEAVAGSERELRDEVVRRILRDVYPGFTPKRAFRALVAPTLTRLHFARSMPPYFRLAPNGRIWKQLDTQRKDSFVALVLYDFAIIRLRLPREYLPPHGNLRDAARNLGEKMIDRVRGLDALLRYYFPNLGQSRSQVNIKAAAPDMFAGAKESLLDLITSSVPRGQIIAVDEIRYAIMNRMLSRASLASSFVVDEWLKLAIQEGILFASRAAFATIESLIMKGYAINTVSVKPKV